MLFQVISPQNTPSTEVRLFNSQNLSGKIASKFFRFTLPSFRKVNFEKFSQIRYYSRKPCIEFSKEQEKICQNKVKYSKGVSMLVKGLDVGYSHTKDNMGRIFRSAYSTSDASVVGSKKTYNRRKELLHWIW